MAEIRDVTVVGAGTMGSQIALQTAYHGYRVRLVDSDPRQLERARDNNSRLAHRSAEKGIRSPEEAEAALARIQPETDLAVGLDGADLVIEAIFEDLEAKRVLWAELGRLAREDAILATNSSTIAISRLADLVPHPERCCNLHFFHPVTVMELCEVVRGPRTSEETVARATGFVRSIGRVPVVLRKEVHGFIANRILFAAAEEAFHLVEGGYATVEDVDVAVKKGLRWPMGPFELLDFSGLDVFYGALEDRARLEGGPGAPELLRQKVARRELGRKTGRGFYEYPASA
jgi:3-hydroxybutyryl-CoA dehydrogenase